jgi:hypothetical protein
MVNSSPFQGEDYGFDPRPGYQNFNPNLYMNHFSRLGSRERQSPDWRTTIRQSGDWRSQAYLVFICGKARPFKKRTASKQTGFVAAIPSRFLGWNGRLSARVANTKSHTPSFAFLNLRLYVQKLGYAGVVNYATQWNRRAISSGQWHPHRFPFCFI